MSQTYTLYKYENCSYTQLFTSDNIDEITDKMQQYIENDIPPQLLKISDTKPVELMMNTLENIG